MNCEKYTAKKVKLFLKNEIDAIVKDLGLNVDFEVMTDEEFSNSDIYKEFVNSAGKDYVDNNLSQYPAFYQDNKIVLLVENVTNDEYLNDVYIAYSLFWVCHELGHHLQNDASIDDKYLFWKLIEDVIRNNDVDFYDYNWDKFYKEAEADLYGISMATEILKKYPHLYESNKEWILQLEDLIKCRISTYDYEIIFDRFDLIDKTDYDNKIIQCIYKDNLKDFNNIETIVFRLNKLGLSYIIAPILSSSAFLRTISFDSLNDVERKIMINVLENTYEDLFSKMGILDIFLESNEYNEFLEKRDRFDEKLEQLDNILNKLNNKEKLCKKKIKPNDC